jgi:hypothetical protein
MSSFWHKTIRGATLGLMFLITAAAPLLTVAVDNDDDDDTPPISVEMNLVAPARKTFQEPAANLSSPFTNVCQSGSFAKAALASQHHPTAELAMGSPQLVVPLRT